MESRSRARLEFWLSLAAVVLASVAALPKAPHLLFAGAALLLFAFVVVLRFQALRENRAKRVDDPAERARRIREARRRP